MFLASVMNLIVQILLFELVDISKQVLAGKKYLHHQKFEKPFKQLVMV